MSLLRPSSFGRRTTADNAVLTTDNDDMMSEGDENENENDDDDNEAMDDEEQELLGEKEDPLLLAIDDLEGRVVAALDDVKMHPGVKTETEGVSSTSVHDELATLLRPVLEVAAHTAPSIARTYCYSSVGPEGVERSVQEVYDRIVSDLVLPVILEMAQSETRPAKRAASLEFLKLLYKESGKPGSWLDNSTPVNALQQGPYGSGGSSSGSSSDAAAAAAAALTPSVRAVLKRRHTVRLARQGEMLRYWVQASIACTLPGAFSNDESEGAVACRAVLAASASLRPALQHIATRIKDADDRGANRLYGPVTKMVEGVLKKMFLSSSISEALLTSCIKFLEILVLCCSRKPKDVAARQQQRRGATSLEGDFSLDDLPSGHPIITREALESIAEYAFTTLRGLTLLGGQVKIDVNLLSDMMLTTGGDGSSPSAQVVSILKPAALAYLEIESALPKIDSDDTLEYADSLDRSNIDFDFVLSQKSYSLTINAMATLAVNRPVYFKESAVCLARRAIKPPTYIPGGSLSQPAVLALTVQLKSSCLTLLRNSLSVDTNACNVLHKALVSFEMDIQADKALAMARQATALKTAGRAARNRANMYYEWDSAAVTSSVGGGGGGGGSSSSNNAALLGIGDDRRSKRQRETDDALAQLRAAKAARGLGHGIQLPTSMADAVDLVLANLVHLPIKRPTTTTTTSKESSRRVPVTLDFVVDAVMTSGASLSQEEGRWYDRDGGTAWSMDLVVVPAAATSEADDQKQQQQQHCYTLGPKLQEILELEQQQQQDEEMTGGGEAAENDKVKKRRKLFHDQCHAAAADALSRIVNNSCCSRSKSLANLGNSIAARLAFTLGTVRPTTLSGLQAPLDFAKRAVADAATNILDSGDADGGDSNQTRESLERFVDRYPLAALGLALNATNTPTTVATTTGGANNNNNNNNLGDPTDVEYSIGSRILNEALLQSSSGSPSAGGDTDENANTNDLYDRSLDVWVASAVYAGKLANEKPNDNDRKRTASRSAANLQREIVNLPRLTKSSLLLVSAMCDIEEITKKASEASRKTSQDSIAASAAAHAAKVAAEKRATAALLVLRDAAFQRDHTETRQCAVECAVAIASGRLPSTASIQDKALKLSMNVLYSKNESLAQFVVQSATSELEYFSKMAVDAHDSLQKANAASEKDENQRTNPQAPQSEEEKQMMNQMRKPALLYMALCVRRPDIIETLFQLCSVDKADVLSKTVRVNMSILARAAAKKHGGAEIAMRVAAMTSVKETPMLLSFLENLAPGSDKNKDAESEIIEACFKIQDSKTVEGGKKDPRYIIPVVSVMKRCSLIERLPEFVAAEDKIFLAALVRMGDRLHRQALLFRDESDAKNPTLHGMTLCEQLVFLHRLDFAAANLQQKRYLAAIKLCLEDDEVYNDRILMSALDHMSGTFLNGTVPTLPLAFMRTVILTCTKHESLHSWICHVLLPRLVQGKIYEDARQWEGWMRCAHMLEKSEDSSVNSAEAISSLPPEQLMQYQTKWAGR